MTRFPTTSHELNMQNMEESRRAEIAERGRHNDLLTGRVKCTGLNCESGKVYNAYHDQYQRCHICHGTGFVKEKLT